MNISIDVETNGYGKPVSMRLAAYAGKDCTLAWKTEFDMLPLVDCRDPRQVVAAAAVALSEWVDRPSAYEPKHASPSATQEALFTE